MLQEESKDERDPDGEDDEDGEDSEDGKMGRNEILQQDSSRHVLTRLCRYLGR